MFPRSGTVMDEYERPIPGASVYVTSIDGTDAVLTSDGTASLGQPLITDEFGGYSYFAGTGYYTEDTWFGGKRRFREHNIVLGNPGSDLLLRADLAATGGSDLVSVQALNGQPTKLQRHIVKNYLEDISGFVEGAGGNPTINAAALNAALANGAGYNMRPGALYRLGNKIKPASNSALVYEGPNGNRPIIFAPAANFNRSDLSSGTRYGDSAVVIGADGGLSGAFTPLSKITVGGFILQFEIADGRALSAFAFRNVLHLTLDTLEVTGMPLGAAFNLQSIQGNSQIRNCFVHDCTTNTTAAGLVAPANAPNVTGFLYGGDEVNGIFNDGIHTFNCRAWDISCGAAFIAANIAAGGSGEQADGFNPASKLNNSLKFDLLDIRRVGEGIDNFGCNGEFSNIYIEDARQFGLKNIHGASRNRGSNIVMKRVGIAGLLLAGSDVAAQDTEANEFSGVSIDTIDPNGTYAANDTAGILIIDQGGTAGKPRNNQVHGPTVRPGPNGKYGYLDSSTGSRNMGHDVDIRDGGGLLKRVLVRNGAGAASVKTSPAYHTNLDPGTIPVPRNIAVPTAYPYVVGQFETEILCKGSGARTVIVPPECNCVVKDALGNAAAGNITVQGAASATATGSIAINADGLGILTITSSPTNPVYEGHGVTGSGVTTGTVVGEWLTGTKGGAGTYRVNIAQTVASTTLTFPASGNIDGAATQVISANYGKVALCPIPGAGNGWSVL